VQQLPLEEKISFIPKLDQELNTMSYDTFFTIEHSYPRFFRQSEIPAVKQYISTLPDRSLTVLSRLYHFLEPGLNDQERETILKKLLDINSQFATELVKLLFDHGRYLETYNLINEKFLDRLQHCDADIMILFLEVEKQLGHEIMIAATIALEKFPRLPVLRKAIAESLDQLSRINRVRSSAIAEEIRTHFKRRRNLIQAIHRF